MKKILVSFLAVIACASVSADPIDWSSAAKKADAFLSKGKGEGDGVVEARLSAEIKSRMAVSPVTSPAFYVFNASDGKGFVIVSGDDDFPEIVGYSYTNSFVVDSNLPEGLADFLEFYSEYVNDVRNGVTDAPEGNGSVFGGAGRLNRATVPEGVPLCKSQWNQLAPYNWYCPEVNGEKCLTGCVATAMSQIMYYYRFPDRPRGKVTYNTGNTNIGIITADLNGDDHIYAWDNMRDAVGDFALPAIRNAMAQLNYDCGVAAKMQYGTDASGAYDCNAYKAFSKNFKYDASTIELVCREYGYTDQEWYSMVKREIDALRPVYFSASSPVDGGKDAAGHAFVIDGYDSDDNVHVNWGWGGAYDGFYSLPKLDPAGYTFTDEQGMIIGIRPGTGDEQRKQYKLEMDGDLSVLVETSSLTLPFDVRIPVISNLDSESHKWRVSIGLFTPDGKFIDEIVKKPNTMTSLTLPANNYYRDGYGDMACQMPKGIAEGDYVIRFIQKEDGFKDWVFPDVVGGGSHNWIPAYVTKGKVRFNEVSTGIEAVDVDEADVISRKYYDVSGAVVAEPVRGSIVIEVMKLRDGSVRSVKRIWK